MPIVGNGLLAREFQKYDIDSDTIIIASGVSNSKEEKKENFLREEMLIKDILEKYRTKKIVYFSTCSIYQSEHTPYIEHKIKMENIITESDVCYFIIRLPQVVGIINNNTLLSNLVKNAYLNNPVKLQENAYRNLLDVEDVSRIIRSVININSTSKGVVLNVASSTHVSVLEIMHKIKEILNSNSDIIIVPGGENYYIDNSCVKKYIGENDIIFSENYAMRIIEKYTRKIRQEFSCEWDKMNNE